MATYHFSQSFRYRIRRDIPLNQLHNLTHPGFLRIRPEEHHHGIRSTINHDPALAGLFKLFFFVRYIIHIHCTFMLCLAAQSPTGKRKIGIPTVNETVNEGANTHFSAGFPCHNPQILKSFESLFTEKG